MRCVYQRDFDNQEILILLYKLIYFDNLTKDRLINFVFDIYDGIRLFEIHFEEFIDSIIHKNCKDTFNN